MAAYATKRIAAEKELDRLAMRVSSFVMGNRDPGRTLSAMKRVIFDDEGFEYDPDPENPDNFLLDRVIGRKRGNCLGLTLVYLTLAERIGLPLRAVYVPSHSFVRYEGDGACINIETGEKGAERKDEWYAAKYFLKEGSPYLRSLGKKETIGLYLKSLGTACSRKGSEEDALHWYRKASIFHPGLPDIRYNAGVSYQRLGKNREAIDQYRSALSLDPDMAVARGNLAAALCNCGCVEDGVKEFLKALEINPSNATVRAGLAKAFFALGAYREAAKHCDLAIKQGCRFDPSMLEVLNRYRAPGEFSTSH
ncbi:MAG: tetratricopeptide repeat protein [Deltaproteobacteria bacterium]|nr:tetratricopeptide repeat protein [Deltaproteobacteria bacterium]